MLITPDERERLNARRDELRARYLLDHEVRPATTTRGVHHVALVSGDVARTTRFYTEVLGFPLTTMFENRDLPGSTHFFFDIGHGNTLAFFDLPGVDPGPYAEVLGGLHHLAISIDRDAWEAARERLVAEGVEIHEASGSSIYFRDPDGARLELISDPLGEMYGEVVL
jgi:catechol 2,3-dioxygenase-like lactoylglutathione lyase family enzyme